MNKEESQMQELVRLRKELHQLAELSGKEVQTAARIQSFLEKTGPDRLLTGLGGTGVLAEYDSGLPGPGILARCELDALPIPETLDLPHASLTSGVAHKCGHDGHMAMMAGLAAELGRNRPGRGKVSCLFQPAEEEGTGARAVLADPRFQALQFDFGMAIHNLPGYPLHQVVCRPGTITSSVESSIIRFQGREAHAALPHNGINPAFAIAEVLQQSRKLEHPDPGSPGFCLFTPIHVVLGEKAYGTAAGKGELHFTYRARTEPLKQEKKDQFHALLDRVTRKYPGLQYQIETLQSFRANTNDPGLVELLKSTCNSLKFNYHSLDHPLSWGEDFGYFSEKIPGLFIGLGAGVDRPDLHDPSYDFPDELAWTGSRLFREMIHAILS